MTLKSNMAIVLSAALLTACASDGGIAPGDSSNQGGDIYAEGSQGAGSGRGSESIEGSNLSNASVGSQEELVANIGDRIFFGFNSASVTATSQQTLQRQSEWLNSNPNVTITVEGHCDERGTREFNLALGEKRATSVKNYLVSLGVDASRVKTISYGKEHPEYLGSNESAWSKNRRSVTVVN
jgi:peptidoglycan-associated lipoprotein